MKLDYCKVGSGEPLIFLPGANAGYLYYEDFISALSEHFTVYAINYPGIMNNTKTPREHSLQIYLDSIEETISSFNLDSFNLLGISFGAYIAVKFANFSRVRLNKIILIAPLTKLRKQSLVENGLRLLLSNFTKISLGLKGYKTYDFAPHNMSRPFEKLKHSKFVLTSKLNKDDIQEYPMLVLLSQNDLLIDHTYTKELFSDLEEAKIVELPPRGHYSFLLQLDGVVEMISEFVNIKL